MREPTFESDDDAIFFMVRTPAPVSNQAAMVPLTQSLAVVLDRTTETDSQSDHMSKVLELFLGISHE